MGLPALELVPYAMDFVWTIVVGEKLVYGFLHSQGLFPLLYVVRVLCGRCCVVLGGTDEAGHLVSYCRFDLVVSVL